MGNMPGAMRILVLTNMYPNPIRPYSGRFIHDHVESLRRLGVEVEVSFTNPKLSRSQYFATLPAIRRALRKGFDVVHVQHTYCMFQLKAAGHLNQSIPPVVLTCHEGELGTPVQHRDSGANVAKRLMYSSKLKQSAVAAADEVVVVSDQIRRGLGLTQRCWVIPPATDMSLFQPMDRTRARSELGMDNDRPIIFFPADARRKSYAKGFDLFEAALSNLDQPLEVISGGDIPPERMPLHMNAADVVVQTSRFEGSPMVIKEAMACCRPVVSTDVGDVQWLFGDAPGHHVVSPDPSSIAVGISQCLRFRGSTGGRRRLEKLGVTLDQTARRHLEVYEQAVRAHAA
jgi:glycosyltransferase involved in cell wall biosynthesis